MSYITCRRKKPISVYEQCHLHYLKEYRKATYTNLLTSGRLNSYLVNIDEQAKDMFFQPVKEYAERQGVTEQLKTDKPLEWVSQMNNIRNAVEEVINMDLIYA